MRLLMVGLVLLVIVTAAEVGHFEALGLALLMATFIRPAGLANTRALRIVLLFTWAAVLAGTSGVVLVASGPQTASRHYLILRLYDLNCSAPFRTYRYPRSVVWLAKNEAYGNWTDVLACAPWIM